MDGCLLPFKPVFCMHIVPPLGNTNFRKQFGLLQISGHVSSLISVRSFSIPQIFFVVKTIKNSGRVSFQVKKVAQTRGLLVARIQRRGDFFIRSSFHTHPLMRICLRATIHFYGQNLEIGLGTVALVLQTAWMFHSRSRTTMCSRVKSFSILKEKFSPFLVCAMCAGCERI